MANIADNLKRLLGTEGNNIQEVLENADSIGGGSGGLPMIEFTLDEDEHWHVGQTVGIEDAQSYVGMCTIKILSTHSPDNISAFIGNAMESVYCLILGANASTINIYIFIVNDGAVDYHSYKLQLS